MNWQWEEFRQTGRDYGQADEVAHYDRSHADFRDLTKEAEISLDLIDAGPQITLLDIGCGTGRFAIAAAARCRAVIGIDVSEAMLSEARWNAKTLGQTNVRFEHAGFLTYEHADFPPDAITTTFALHHLPDYWQAVALRRIYAMLAPGGRFLLRDVVIPDCPRLTEPVEAFISKQYKAGGDFLREDAEGHFREEFSTFDWVVEGMLARAGFTILERRIDSHVIATYLCKKAAQWH